MATLEARPVRRVLDRLEDVEQRRSESWVATCPVCQERGRSLKVTELDDGSCLMHCHAGCAARDVVTALQLSFAELAAPPERSRDDVLVAKYFHSYDGEVLRWRGIVMAPVLGGTHYLVQLFEGVAGELSCQRVVPASDLWTWKLYDTAQEWQAAYARYAKRQPGE